MAGRKANELTGFFHEFPTLNEARQFVDETLIALEYLGCIVTDMNAGGTGVAIAAG